MTRIVHDIRPTSSGSYIYEIWPGTGGMVEIDVLGNILRRWHFTGTAKDIAEGSIPVATDTFHHDYTELPSGNILLLSTENRVLDTGHDRCSGNECRRREFPTGPWHTTLGSIGGVDACATRRESLGNAFTGR